MKIRFGTSKLPFPSFARNLFKVRSSSSSRRRNVVDIIRSFRSTSSMIHNIFLPSTSTMSVVQNVSNTFTSAGFIARNILAFPSKFMTGGLRRSLETVVTEKRGVTARTRSWIEWIGARFSHREIVT